MIQTRLKSKKPKVKYSYGPYNKFNDTEQWIRISEGCPHNCPFCYEPREIKLFEIPRITRRFVKIMDMNLLCKPESLEIIKQLGKVRVDGKVVYYELICGIDHRFFTDSVAVALHDSRFINIRLAWDWGIKDQYKIKDAIEMLIRSGYPSDSLMVFMICNWKIPYSLAIKKLDLLKVWRVKVDDCYYDNQSSPNIVPLYWTPQQIKKFRKKCRLHNHLVNFKIYPEGAE